METMCSLGSSGSQRRWLQEIRWGGAAQGSGTWYANFAEHAAVATRTYSYEHGTVCSSWQVWGMAKDRTGGAEHACALAEGSIFCWGTGKYGQLGGRLRFATVPQMVE